MRHLPGLVSRDVCQWMIEHARPRLTRALVYDAVEDKSTANQTRTNTVALFNVTNSDLVSVLIQVQICANTGVSFRQLEPLSVLHYDVGEQIIEHFDFVDPDAPTFDQQVAEYGQRKITFLLYLNEDYTGGETELPKIGISHKGQLGGGFFFVNIRGNESRICEPCTRDAPRFAGRNGSSRSGYAAAPPSDRTRRLPFVGYSDRPRAVHRSDVGRGDRGGSEIERHERHQRVGGTYRPRRNTRYQSTLGADY